MRAVILAGGEGTRLRPFTTVLPKPLMPIHDRPILDVVVRQLAHARFERITIATGYLAELIEAFFRNGDRYQISIDYHVEDEPLGTVGPLALIDGLESETAFLVMNGDVLTDIDYRRLMAAHTASGATLTIATHKRSVQVSLGVMGFGDDRDPTRVTDFIEKPTYDYDVSMGIYCFSGDALEFIEPGRYLDLPTLIHRLIDAGKVVRGFPFAGYWMDIGRHEDYEQATEEFAANKARLLPSP